VHDLPRSGIQDHVEAVGTHDAAGEPFFLLSRAGSRWEELDGRFGGVVVDGGRERLEGGSRSSS